MTGGIGGFYLASSLGLSKQMTGSYQAGFVVFALLAGESLFGIAGALLAVPVLSIVQSLFLHYREVMLGVPAPRSSPGNVAAPAD